MKNKMHGINRVERLTREKTQRFMRLVAAGSGNVENHAGTPTGV